MKSIRLLTAAALLLLSASAYPATTRFAAITEAYSNLQLGTPAPIAATYTIAHATFRMDGTAAPIMAGKELAGLYFKGNGSLTYEAAEPVELPIVNFNVRKESHLRNQADAKHAQLSTTFESMAIYVSGGDPLPALTGSAAAVSSMAGFKDHVEKFQRDRGGIPLGHLAMLQKLAFPGGRIVRAEMDARDTLVYVYDGVETFNEDLYALKVPDFDDPHFKQRLYPTVLSEQPIGRDRRETAKAPFYLSALDYTLLAEGDNAKLTATETISRQSASQAAIRLSMNDTAFVRQGAPLRNYHVTSVTDEQGHSVPFDHTLEDLAVGLENVKGDVIKLTFNIEGDFLVHPNGDAFWQLGTTAWFPQPDLNGQFYTLHSVVKVKKPYIAFAPGKTIRRGEEGDFNVVENMIDKPVQFAVVHAGKYDYTEETREGLTIRVCSYAGKNERASKQLTNLAFQVIDYYKYFLGPFPFPEVNIIQVNTFGYGQAPPGTMFITNEAFNSTLGEVNKFFSEGVNERFAHELAHQYWGHVVKMPSGDEQWLTESFAEYSAALVLKKYKGDAVYNRLVAHWKLRAKDAGTIAPIPLANRIAGIERTELLYYKGPYLLYALHKEMGDVPFLTFLKSYQKSFQWKYGSTNDVAGLLQFLTKKDYKPFFEQYYWGTAMPN
ncbi:MAG: hypothetical protein JWN02_1710 [Acidobacteria bacterium]|nr:hypothetical protein [Acidobacteriota bacterium]